MENEISIAVNEEDAQRRIDVFLSEKIENMSRSHAQKLIGQKTPTFMKSRQPHYIQNSKGSLTAITSFPKPPVRSWIASSTYYKMENILCFLLVSMKVTLTICWLPT